MRGATLPASRTTATSTRSNILNLFIVPLLSSAWLKPQIDELPHFGIIGAKAPTEVNMVAQQIFKMRSTYIYLGGLWRGSR